MTTYAKYWDRTATGYDGSKFTYKDRVSFHPSVKSQHGNWYLPETAEVFGISPDCKARITVIDSRGFTYCGHAESFRLA